MNQPVTLINMTIVQTEIDYDVYRRWTPMGINGVPLDVEILPDKEQFFLGPTNIPVAAPHTFTRGNADFSSYGMYVKDNPLISPGSDKIIGAIDWANGRCIPLIDADGVSYREGTILVPEALQSMPLSEYGNLFQDQIAELVYSWSGVNIKPFFKLKCPLEFKYSGTTKCFSAHLDLSAIANKFGKKPKADPDFYNRVINYVRM